MWLALVLGTGALAGFLAWLFPDALYAERDRVRLVYLVLLLALVSSSILAGRRLRLRGVAKAAGLWALIVAVVVLGTAYRHELGAIGERVLGEFLPHRGIVLGESEVRFPAGADGHFRVKARVDGTPIRFLVDTGASNIVLSPADARRIGFDPQQLRFTGFAETANGTVRTAAVRLGTIEIGPIRLHDVPASVNRAAMRGSLLGMSFLERLRSFEVRDGTLILRR
ncbi:MAG: retropepsin-like aspartic protease family protein [Alphaproteobacteria bacterium]